MTRSYHRDLDVDTNLALKAGDWLRRAEIELFVAALYKRYLIERRLLDRGALYA